MFRRLIVFGSIIFTLGLSSLTSGQSPVLDRILKDGELRVAVSGTQPPFNVVDKEGNVIGLEVDLVRMLAEAMNVDLTLMTVPFPDLLPTLKARKVDLVLSGLSITPARAREVAFVGPYMLSGKTVLTDSRTLTSMKTPRDLDKPELTLVVLEASTSQTYAQRVAPKAKLVTTKDYETAVNMVLNDEADALIADMPICILTVLRNPDKDLATTSTPFNIEPIGIALSASDLRFHNLIDTYIDAFEKTGVLDELRAKWLEDGTWVRAIP